MGNINMIRNTVFNKVCVLCGSKFQSKAPNAKYCNECRTVIKSSRFKTHREMPIKRSLKICECCKTEFIPKANNSKLCDDCKIKKKQLNYLRKPILVCPTCGGYFTKTGNNQKRCEICQYKQLYAGDYRTIAFENLPKVCNRCGKELTIFDSDVHHRDRDRKNNKLDNLEILCKSCHHLEHMQRDAKTGKIITNK